ncbi:MAG: DUF2807 domain-containing protein [Polyangiales bacterium]
MKHTTLVVALLLGACADDASVVDIPGDSVGDVGDVGVNIQGDGKRTTEARVASGFQRVESDAVLPVKIAQGAFRVAVSFDANLVPFVKTEVLGDTLHISLDAPAGILSKIGGQVEVALPLLRSASTSGSGMTIAVTQSDALDVSTHGNGDIALSGSAPSARLLTDGNGSIEARDFSAATGEVRSEHNGSIRATFTNSVEAYLNGNGSIDLHGGAQVAQQDDGNGDITVH